MWHLPTELPACNPGDMIPVILQRNGKVFGGWFLNAYPLYDEDDSIEGVCDDNGRKLSTGFAEKVPHGEFDTYYEFAALHDLQCWAYMPAANDAALSGNQAKLAGVVRQLQELGYAEIAGIISDYANLDAEDQRLRDRLLESMELLNSSLRRLRGNLPDSA